MVGWLRAFRGKELDDEQQGCMLVIGALAIFGISSILTWREFSYFLFAATADAEVLRVNEVEIPGRRGPVPRLRVEYAFLDESTQASRTEIDMLAIGTPIGEREPVQYYPGERSGARLKVAANQVPVVVFTASLLIVGYAIWKLYREANAPRPRRRRR